MVVLNCFNLKMSMILIKEIKMENVQILGDYPLSVISADGEDEILFGQLALIPKSQIKYCNISREIIDSHAGLMEDKIRKYGFLDVIKVFKPTKKEPNLYLPAEGNNRNTGLDWIFDSTSDTLIPCLILPEIYDVANIDEALEVIIGLNKDNKAWTVVNYIKARARSGKKPIYKEIYNVLVNNIKNYEQVTPPLTCYIYTGSKGNDYQQLKDGDWNLPDYKLYKPFVDLFMDTYRVWCSNPSDGGLGVKTHEFHNTFSSNLVCMLWGKVKDSLKKNMTEAQRLNDFYGFIEFLNTELRNHMNNKKKQPQLYPNLPKAVDEIRIWFDNEWDTYRKSVPEPAKDITIHFADPVNGQYDLTPRTDKSIST